MSEQVPGPTGANRQCQVGSPGRSRRLKTYEPPACGRAYAYVCCVGTSLNHAKDVVFVLRMADSLGVEKDHPTLAPVRAGSAGVLSVQRAHRHGMPPSYGFASCVHQRSDQMVGCCSSMIRFHKAGKPGKRHGHHNGPYGERYHSFQQGVALVLSSHDLPSKAWGSKASRGCGMRDRGERPGCQCELVVSGYGGNPSLTNRYGSVIAMCAVRGGTLTTSWYAAMVWRVSPDRE